MTARLQAHVVVRRADITVDVELQESGGGLALLGHNGAGKSTLLRALAGLVPLDSGHVVLDGRTLERRGESARVRVPSQERGIGLLDQKPRLFPHLTLRRNIAFGPRSQGATRRQADEQATRWLDRVGLGARAEAKPHEISGGQQQRVAIARALAAGPRLVLLDEPFAALDAESAPAVRRMLVEELGRTGTTGILVTHDLSDAWQMADEAAVLSAGRVVDRGAPGDLAARPGHPFTAALAGFGVVRGRLGADMGARADASTGDEVATIGIVPPSAVEVLSVAAPGTDPEPPAQECTPAPWISTLVSVSARGGSLRLQDEAGLVAELSLDRARAVGGGSLPAAGDRAAFRVDSSAVRIVPEAGRLWPASGGGTI